MKFFYNGLMEDTASDNLIGFWSLTTEREKLHDIEELKGVGPSGKKSSLARVSIVNEHGVCLYKEFVKPPEEVTDYRTHFSGIRMGDLDPALPFDTVAKQVRHLVGDHILVGHGLEHDLIALGLDRTFPLRDCVTQTFEGPRPQAPNLKDLVRNHIKIKIQTEESGHNPIIDAPAAKVTEPAEEKVISF